MRRALLLALFSVSCKDDPPEPSDCSGPDFVVSITAPGEPLPRDTVVQVVYGGGEEERFELAAMSERSAVFCQPADRDGNPIQDAGSSGIGEGGATGRGVVEALRCELWTDGPAQVTLESEHYPPQEPVDLEPSRAQCTVHREIEFVRDDGGA